MVNYEFELDRLRYSLLARGVDRSDIDQILSQAKLELFTVMEEAMDSAMTQAIQVGVEKKSSDFITELRPRPGAFELTTDSGNTSFTTPPFPMMSKLLQGAKPIKDGSGVYKVIPVGAPSNKPYISNNIFDVYKQQLARQHEELLIRSKQQKGGGKPQFRTITSKQSSESWVQPARTSDFTEELTSINQSLDQTLRDKVEYIIRKYEESN
jgi:hypothetical protein